MDLEPIPYFYDPINRNAILVRPKKPFFDWVNNVFKDDEPISELEECNIYLIREMDSNDAIQKWLKKNFDNIFINELNDWYTEEDVWPSNRTFKMFSEWFDVELHSMILDLEKLPIIKN
ncbi:hypothetical protein [Cytophaga aurantiaca]|uniref:hypothetical protein n=1 Tax=Cytophaga aurantiaca TaxID=29530 RepID=UPI000377F891|nr:hypothetical protein [Cytophaga aurantiaca]